MSARPISVKRKRRILVVTCLLAAILFGYIYKLHSAELNWHAGTEMAKFSNYEKAEILYQDAYPDLKYNGDFLFNYGAEACLSGRYQLSIKLLEKCKKVASSDNIFIYLGDSYAATCQFALAEKNYLHAAYMAPSHLFPKYKLVKLYTASGQKEKALFWKHKALTFPLKVKSANTDELVRELREEL